MFRTGSRWRASSSPPSPQPQARARARVLLSLLLNYGADAALLNSRGCLALHYASSSETSGSLAAPLLHSQGAELELQLQSSSLGPSAISLLLLPPPSSVATSAGDPFIKFVMRVDEIQCAGFGCVTSCAPLTVSAGAYCSSAGVTLPSPEFTGAPGCLLGIRIRYPPKMRGVSCFCKECCRNHIQMWHSNSEGFAAVACCNSQRGSHG